MNKQERYLEYEKLNMMGRVRETEWKGYNEKSRINDIKRAQRLKEIYICTFEII